MISLFQPNKHYRDDDAYLGALADAMAMEFRAIVDAGLVLQVDSPDLALGRQTMYAHLTEDEFVHRLGAHVAALNAALDGIPQDRVRLHLCWGNYEGPHTMGRAHRPAAADRAGHQCRIPVVRGRQPAPRP